MGSVTGAPPGDRQDAWRSLGRLPDDMESLSTARPASRVFAASRKFGGGSVVVYAQDGLTLDEEITDGSDNLLFAQNALAWLTPLEVKDGMREGDHGPGVGGHLCQDRAHAARARVHRAPRLGPAEAHARDVRRPTWSAPTVLWYLSDWEPPPEFADWHVPLIEDFVRGGGGLLVGGLGWSYAAAGRPRRGGGHRPVCRRSARQAVRLRLHARRVQVAMATNRSPCSPGRDRERGDMTMDLEPAERKPWAVLAYTVADDKGSGDSLDAAGEGGAQVDLQRRRLRRR